MNTLANKLLYLSRFPAVAVFSFYFSLFLMGFVINLETILANGFFMRTLAFFVHGVLMMIPAFMLYLLAKGHREVRYVAIFCIIISTFYHTFFGIFTNIQGV